LCLTQRASRLADESGSRLPQSREYSPCYAFRISSITLHRESSRFV
jgi:hypothetical protein